MNPSTPITIIGAGHIGTSIIRRLISNGHKNIIATRRNEEELQKLKERFPSVTITTNNKEAVEKAEVIILSTKQNSFQDVSKQIKAICDGKTIISTGPTYKLAQLKELFGEKDIRLIMPVNPSADIICYASNIDKEAEEVMEHIFGKSAVKVPEEEMPVATTYVLFRGVVNSLFEPLCNIGAEAGFNKVLAKEAIGNMLISTGEEIKQGITAQERLANASYNLDEQSFTMKLYHQLEPAQKLLQELFEKFCQDFKK